MSELLNRLYHKANQAYRQYQSALPPQRRQFLEEYRKAYQTYSRQKLILESREEKDHPSHEGNSTPLQARSPPSEVPHQGSKAQAKFNLI